MTTERTRMFRRKPHIRTVSMPKAQPFMAEKLEDAEILVDLPSPADLGLPVPSEDPFTPPTEQTPESTPEAVDETAPEETPQQDETSPEPEPEPEPEPLPESHVLDLLTSNPEGLAKSALSAALVKLEEYSDLSADARDKAIYAELTRLRDLGKVERIGVGRATTYRAIL